MRSLPVGRTGPARRRPGSGLAALVIGLVGAGAGLIAAGLDG